ncbi:hypothetical protein D3C81_1781990 [compost metagenome]
MYTINTFMNISTPNINARLNLLSLINPFMSLIKTLYSVADKFLDTNFITLFKNLSTVILLLNLLLLPFIVIIFLILTFRLLSVNFNIANDKININIIISI